MKRKLSTTLRQCKLPQYNGGMPYNDDLTEFCSISALAYEVNGHYGPGMHDVVTKNYDFGKHDVDWVYGKIIVPNDNDELSFDAIADRLEEIGL